MKILLISLLFLAALALPVASVFAAPAKYTARVTLGASGIIQYTGTINLSDLSKAAAAEAAAAAASDNSSSVSGAETAVFPMLRPPVSGAGQRVVQHNAATRKASVASHSSVNPLLRGFTGLRHLDSRLARGGEQFSIEPPDQALAVGNGFVLEAINCALSVYDTNGFIQLNPNGTTHYPVALTTFFGLPAAFTRPAGPFHANPGDVVALYDTETQRWFVEAWAQGVNTVTGAGNNTSKIYLAVSKTSDPTGAYKLYQINTSTFPDGQGPRIPDYAKIGLDHNGLYISVNEFKISNGAFIGARIFAIRKSDLESGVAAPAMANIGIPNGSAGGYEFTIMPQMVPPTTAYVTTNGGTTYFVSAQFVFNTECTLGVWSITNTNFLNGSGSGLLQLATVNTQCYNFPSQAVLQQPGFTPLGDSLGESLEQLDPGDFRIGGQNIVFTNSELFATLATEVTDSFSNQVMGAAWFVLHPTITGGTLNATVTAQGIISLDGASFLRPAIAMNTQLFGAVVGTQVGPTDFPSSAIVGFNGFTQGDVQITRAGNEPEDGFSGYAAFGGGGVARWGDYSAAAINDDNSLWVATEYTPDINRTSLANWATYVSRVQLNH